MHVRRTTLPAVAVIGALVMAGCAAPAPGPVGTAAPAPAAPSAKQPVAQKFTAAGSGKLLAARLMARVRTTKAGAEVTGVECKDFPNIKVGTHTDCQARVSGAKRGYLVTFTERDGHYVVKPQKLTW